MIGILADSPDDEELISNAAVSETWIVDDPGRLANEDTQVECLILGCRHPIPPEKIELLRTIERDAPWVTVILVTDRKPGVARLLSDIRVAAVVWFETLRIELEPRIAAATQLVPLLRLAEQVEEANLPPALRSGLAYSLRAATRRPLRSVADLAAAVRYSPVTLSKEFREGVGGAETLSRFLGALSVVKAQKLRLWGLSWEAVAERLGLKRQTLHDRSTRWPGSTLKQIEGIPPATLLAQFVSDFMRPLLKHA